MVCFIVVKVTFLPLVSENASFTLYSPSWNSCSSHMMLYVKNRLNWALRSQSCDRSHWTKTVLLNFCVFHERNKTNSLLFTSSVVSDSWRFLSICETLSMTSVPNPPRYPHQVNYKSKLLIWINVNRSLWGTLRSRLHWNASETPGNMKTLITTNTQCFKNTLVLLLITNLYKQQQGILFKNSFFAAQSWWIHVYTPKPNMKETESKCTNHLSIFTIRWSYSSYDYFNSFLCFNLFEISLWFLVNNQPCFPVLYIYIIKQRALHIFISKCSHYIPKNLSKKQEIIPEQSL